MCPGGRLGRVGDLYGWMGAGPGTETPSPMDRMTDRHDWKHYLSATSLAGGNNTFCLKYEIKMFLTHAHAVIFLLTWYNILYHLRCTLHPTQKVKLKLKPHLVQRCNKKQLLAPNIRTYYRIRQTSAIRQHKLERLDDHKCSKKAHVAEPVYRNFFVIVSDMKVWRYLSS